jgi:tRNA A-37 threonylcarbamoyl transferase component Bud32
VKQLTFDNIRWEVAPDFEPLLPAVLASSFRVVKESQAKLVAEHRVGDTSFFVKRYRHFAVPLRPLKFFFKASQAREEWRFAQAVEERGIPVVRHVALGERWTVSGLQESILITEGFAGVPANEAQALKDEDVIAFIERIAMAGVMHRDLHPANLLIRGEPFEMRLVDLHGIHFPHPFDRQGNRDHMLAQLRMSLPLKVPENVEWFSQMLRQRALKKRSSRCLRTNRDFSVKRIGGWKWNVRTAAVNSAVEKVLSDPDEFIENGRALKQGRSSTVAAAQGLVLKRYNFKKPLNLLKDLFRGSRGRRNFRKAYHLELCGIPTARVVATADARVLGVPVRSYVLMAEITPGTHAGVWDGDERTAARRLGRLIASLHREGFVHRDLKETNILFDANGDPHLIDLDGLAFVGVVVSEDEVISNLKRLAEGLASRCTRSNVITFLIAYCRLRRVKPRAWLGARSHRS